MKFLLFFLTVWSGQFMPWNLFIKLVQPFSNGLHRLNDRMWLYVSAGTGYWGPPQRLEWHRRLRR